MTDGRGAGSGPQSHSEGPPATPPSRRGGAARPARRPDPPPLEVDESRVIAIGIAAWAMAFLVMLCFHSRLAHDHRSWWPFTALAGIGLGLWGWWLVRKRVAQRRAAPTGASR